MGVVGATGGREISRRMVSDRASQRALFAVSPLLFAASAAATILWSSSMSGWARYARRLDDVDGVDANVRTDVARRRGVFPPTVPEEDLYVTSGHDAQQRFGDRTWEIALAGTLLLWAAQPTP
jgi:hypothetical protein